MQNLLEKVGWNKKKEVVEELPKLTDEERAKLLGNLPPEVNKEMNEMIKKAGVGNAHKDPLPEFTEKYPFEKTDKNIIEPGQN